MAVLSKVHRPEAAPALYRLLSESALSRAALGACGFPVALIDAGGAARKVTYVNSAFASYFGWHEADAVGRPLASLLFRGEEAALQRLLADPGSRWLLMAYGKDGEQRRVELTIGALRSADGRLTHWVLSFSDRSEEERLRCELQGLRALAAPAQPAALT
jgi:PAS domain S-box-containing protein